MVYKGACSPTCIASTDRLLRIAMAHVVVVVGVVAVAARLCLLGMLLVLVLIASPVLVLDGLDGGAAKGSLFVKLSIDPFVRVRVNVDGEEAS